MLKQNSEIKAWESWYEKNHTDLFKGHKVKVEENLIHPREISEFKKLLFADDVGQAKDWAISIHNGSRLHIHEYSDGQLVGHLDKYDPGKSIFHAVTHWATESKSGLSMMGLISQLKKIKKT